MRVSIVLRPRHLAELKQRAGAGYYRRGHFLSVSQFTARYGQPRSVIRKFVAYLHGTGVKVRVYRDRLNIAIQGSAAQINAIFGVKLKDYRVPATRARNGRAAVPAQVVHGTNQNASLPPKLAKVTLAVFGLTSYHGAFASKAIKARHVTTRPRATGDQGPPAGQLTPADFLRLYHGKTLQKAGHGGAGQTIGIVTFATLPVADAYSFWHQLGIPVSPNRISLRNIDGGSGPVSVDLGSDETALDVEQSGGIANRAKIIVYQAANTEAAASDAYFTAVSDNKADSISTSWGDSETFYQAMIGLGKEPKTYFDAVDVPLLEAAAQGQANFSSSGDQGAYDASIDVGSSNLAVDYVQSSAYTTSAGGTTLSAAQYPQVYAMPNGKTLTIKIPRERAWGWDYFFPTWQVWNTINGTNLTEQQFAIEQSIAGGGGGVSAVNGMPAYQKQFPGIRKYSAVENLTPIDPTTAFPDFGFPELPFALPSTWKLHPSPATVSGTVGNHRLTPDVSTNADPQTGYAVYSKIFGPVYGANWEQFGGTSFVSPQLNGVSALIQGQAGGRVGLWNPSIYRFGRSPHSPFRPLNAQGSIGQTTVKHTAGGPVYTVPGNNNLYWSGRPGTRYNMGSGLGIPNLTKLGRAFSR